MPSIDICCQEKYPILTSVSSSYEFFNELGCDNNYIMH